MATTRSSQGSAKSSSASATKAGSKRSAESQSSPAAKRGRPSKQKKQQKTIKETMNGVEDDKDVAKQINGHANEGDAKEIKESQEQEYKESEDADARKTENGEQNGVKDGQKNAFDEVKADTGEVKDAAKQEQEEKTENIANNNESIIEDEKREAAIPSSILEKGIIYFFFRGRVGVEDPQGIEDVARSYIVLRPLPIGAKLGEGPLEDSGNARLLALPKKTLPKSHKDRFLAFVERPNAFIKDLRDQFAGNEYVTKTKG
jgi:hypothetical protein